MAGPDVQGLQRDLNRRPTLLDRLDPDGIFGSLTDGRVREFQEAANLNPDGIVGPQTRAALAATATATDDSDFTGFSDEQIDIIKADLVRARQFLDEVLTRLSFAPFMQRSPLPIALEALNKIFHIDFTLDPTSPAGQAGSVVSGSNLFILSRSFAALRRSLDVKFPKVFHPPGSPPPVENAGFFVAWTDTVTFEPTMHFSWRYFDPLFNPDGKSRSLTIIHERAHTVLRLAGHPGTGDSGSPDGKPHNGSFRVRDFQTASRNPYCYEWLTESLQFDYNPNGP